MKLFLHHQIYNGNKEMIIFAELFMTGAQHAAFNAAMLEVWHEAFPKQSLLFYTSASHLQAVQKYQTTKAYKPKIISVIPNKTGSKWTWFRKFTNEAYQIVNVLHFARQSNASLVCFSFLSPLGHFLLNAYLKLFKPKLQILVILHGLEILKPSKQHKKIDQVYAFLLTKTFQRASKNIRYIVLEPSAKTYLIRRGLVSVDKLLYLPHPYIFTKKTASKSVLGTKLSLGHIGIARLDKQSDKFFELAAFFKEDIAEGKISFQVIGAVLPEMKPFLNKWIDCFSDETLLSHESYNARLQAIDYAVFCYATDTYELTTSGAVMDAIAFQKPILALRNKSLEHVFNLTDVKPGHLFDNINDLKIFIKEQMANSNDHNSYKEAFLKLQAYFSVTNVATLLVEALKEEGQ